MRSLFGNHAFLVGAILFAGFFIIFQSRVCDTGIHWELLAEMRSQARERETRNENEGGWESIYVLSNNVMQDSLNIHG